MFRCNECLNLSVNRCFDCKEDLCQDCSRLHKEPNHLHCLQPVTDSYILNHKFDFLVNKVLWIKDVQFLNDKLLVATIDGYGLITFSLRGDQQKSIHFEGEALKIAVLDEDTVAVLVSKYSNTFCAAKVDIQQRNDIQYINNNSICCKAYHSFMCIENQMYVVNDSEIIVIDMSGTINIRFSLSFTPFEMCYDIGLNRIYCIEIGRNKLHCIDKKGMIKYSLDFPKKGLLQKLTIDSEGNVLMLCRKRFDDSDCVIKIDSNSKSYEVIMSSAKRSRIFKNSCICCRHLSNAVVVGVDQTVYIYKKNKAAII